MQHHHALAPPHPAPQPPDRSPNSRGRWTTVTVALLVGLAGGVASAGPAAAAPRPADGTGAADTITGTYELLHADPPPVVAGARAPQPAELPADATHDVVRQADGTVVEVDGAADLFEDVVPGQQVAVTGESAPDDATVAAADTTFEATSVRELAAEPDATAVSTRTLAVVLLRLGSAGAEPMSAETTHRNFFTGPDSVAAYFRESSFSQLELAGRNSTDGDVYGYLEVPADTPCWAEEQAGSAAAQAAGIDLSGYDHVAFVLDSVDRGCWYGGWAYIGGRVSVNLYYGDEGTRMVAQHELGHNLGLNHANSLYCTAADGHTTSIEEGGSWCTVQEYGDPFDAMGNTWNGMQFSANYKARLGWIPPSRVTTVTESGDYTVAPSEVTTDQPQNLRIPLPSGQYYDIDVRRPFGQYWDAKVAQYPALLNGVSVRRADDWGTSLIDMTPNGWFDEAALVVGQTFTDAAAGVSIRTESVGPEGAVVHVELAAVEQQVALRGTHTGWEASPMTKVSGTESTWTAQAQLSATDGGTFRFEVTPGNGSYGDNEPDGVADLAGTDVVAPGDGTYTITFDLATLQYSVEPVATGFVSTYPTMTLRGTSTQWAPVPLELVADHTWRVTMAFGAHPVEELLFDVDGTGATAFGDAEGDATAEPGGPNIPMTQGPAIYEVTFHDDTLAYSVVRTTP